MLYATRYLKTDAFVPVKYDRAEFPPIPRYLERLPAAFRAPFSQLFVQYSGDESIYFRTFCIQVPGRCFAPPQR